EVDAFQLERLGRRFETVLDCGLFHTFAGDERPGYVARLASATEHDGTLIVVCCRDDAPAAVPHANGQEAPSAASNPIREQTAADSEAARGFGDPHALQFGGVVAVELQRAADNRLAPQRRDQEHPGRGPELVKFGGDAHCRVEAGIETPAELGEVLAHAEL